MSYAEIRAQAINPAFRPNQSKICPSHFVRIFELVSLSVEIGFLLLRVMLWKCIGGCAVYK
jgi:hypothetical protein